MARRMPLVEFIAMMAMLFSMVAFSIDAMLPGLPEIAADLTPDTPNRAQLVITAFMLGLGLGTFFAGPLADAYGRKKVVVFGIGIFLIGCGLAFYAQSLEMLLAARALQGLGVAGPRIAPMAIVRDIYSGRKMAQITSFVTTVFMLVPAAAPSIGAMIINQWEWRSIFLVFGLFAVIAGSWLTIRQDETLDPANRREFRAPRLLSGMKEVLSNRPVMIFTAVTTLAFATLISMLSSSQQIYSVTFDQRENFPLWFGLMAILSAPGTLLNAALVVRVGMRRLVIWAFGAQILASLTTLGFLIMAPAGWPLIFPIWFGWSVVMLFCVGLILGNLQALTLLPLGHMAGMGASVTIALSTVVAVFIGGPVGLAFDGTPVPLLIAASALSCVAFLIMFKATREEPET